MGVTFTYLLVWALTQRTSIEVDAVRAVASGSTVIVVNVENGTGAVLNEVRLSLYGVRSSPQRLGQMGPGQQKTAIMRVANTAESVVIVVSCMSKGTQMSVGRVVPPAFAAPGVPWPTILPAVMTLVGTLAGAFVAHVLTSRRDMASQERLARAARMTGAMPALSMFLTNWNASILPNVLEAQFSVLARSVMLPTSLTNAYNSLMGELRDSSVSTARKDEATAAFAERIRSLSMQVDAWR